MVKEHVKLKVSELKENSKNPKLHADTLIKKSINELGFVDDIVVDENNVILAGHGRLKALKDLGQDEVDVIRISGWTEEQKEKYLLLNNRSVELGGWDKELLKEFDRDLLSEAGFNDMLDDLSAVKEDNFDAEAEYQKITEPKMKLGEMYQLGRHRLICGDSTKAEYYEALLGEEKIRMIFADPPYNVNYHSPGGLDYSSVKFGGTGGKIFNDNKTDEECLAFYTNVLKRLYEFSTDDVAIYWWFANCNHVINRQAFEASGWHMSQVLIWLKNSMVFSHGQDYHRQYEPCMFGWKEKKAHYKSREINNLKDVFNLDFDDFNEMLDVWYEKRDATQSYVHPTQKPVRLPERGIKKNSQVNDIVFDAFGGSGSTLIACEQLKRRARLIELDPKYCDVIIKRWEEFTKKDAIKLKG